MRRSPVILFGVLAVGAAVFAGAFLLSRQISLKEKSNPADELAWLCCEFQLDTNTLARVRQLHEGYKPKCEEMCLKIADKKRELEVALTGTTNVSAVVEKNLLELGELRAQCQAQMLKHFVEVSQAMPPEQGRRYLVEMQRLTLGFHEQIEQSMSDHAGHEQHHH